MPLDNNSLQLNHKKHAYTFMFLNGFFSWPLFISFVWSPDLGFYTFKHSLNSDPEGVILFFLCLFSIVISGACLVFNKDKVALIFALLPEMIFFFAILLGFILMLLGL